MFRKIGLLAAALAVVALTAVASAPSAGASADGPSATTNGATTTTPSAGMDRWPLRIEGRPAGLDAGDANGWYFWSDASGLHIRTTTPADRNHVFTAVLTTSGVFRDVDKVRLENADDIRVLDGGHKLVVRFHTYAGMDGVDFRIGGGDGVRLRLDEAGRTVPPARIFLGRFGVHPANNPFDVLRREA
ncbi:MAG: hypothetical protein IVW36_11435 [Dehalococcoidia bacterium]|nr:hypothetical protein [Dehalococcoidia bacterium]